MEEKLTYLALGDSYTIGEYVSEMERWPMQLTKKMCVYDIQISEPQIIAKTGWTTNELKQKLIDENITQTYNLVSLLIGVNNQYRGLSLEQFRIEFVELLDIAIKFAGGSASKVFVVSIPDWGVSPFANGKNINKIAKEIDSFNAVQVVETTKKGILFIDITDISRIAISDTSLIADDGLHPSAKMYEQWIEKITKELLKIL